MNRPIKFMARDTKKKEWINPLHIMIDGDGDLYRYDEDADDWDCEDVDSIVLYEFTGLLDNTRTKEHPNGKPIYEGHIVEAYDKTYDEEKREWLPDEQKPFLFEIAFELGSGGDLSAFVFESINHDRSCVHLGADDYCKIISHIAEEKVDAVLEGVGE